MHRFWGIIQTSSGSVLSSVLQGVLHNLCNFILSKKQSRTDAYESLQMYQKEKLSEILVPAWKFIWRASHFRWIAVKVAVISRSRQLGHWKHKQKSVSESTFWKCFLLIMHNFCCSQHGNERLISYRWYLSMDAIPHSLKEIPPVITLYNRTVAFAFLYKRTSQIL